MKVSVVIVVHNRFRDADDAINSLITQSVKPYEIIVIDDYSYTVYKPKINIRNNDVVIRLYRSSYELGLGRARSIGSYLAQGDVVAFIDDDAIAHKDWIKELINYHSRGYDIVGGAVYPKYLVDPPKWWNLELFSYIISAGNYLHYSKKKIIDLIYGTNFSVTKAVFNKIGYFLPSLGRVRGKLLSGEEYEFLLRAVKLGFRLGFNPKAIVYHKVFPYRFSIEYIKRRCWSQGASYARILLVHRDYLNYFKRILGYPLSMPWIIIKGYKKEISHQTQKIHLICELYRRMGFIFSAPK